MMVDVAYLTYPLYGLYHTDSIDDYSGLSFEQWEKSKTVYTKEQLENIIISLKWAVENKDYDFGSLLPDLPFDNAQIYEYLCKMEKSLKAYEAQASLFMSHK